MSQELFDKGIKEALENMNVAFNADHWQQMEMLLHNLPVGDEGVIDAHFDAMINDKIGQFEVPINHAVWTGIEADLTNAEAADIGFDTAITAKLANPSGTAALNWDSIEQALDVEAAADAQFDTAITAKLANPIGAAALNWDSIEQALDIEAAADAQFDEEIYARLQNLQASPPANYWQRLVNKLNANLALREKLYRYKLMEATLMILLLLNFYQYLPHNTTFFPTSGQQEQPLRQATKQPTLPVESVIEKSEVPTVLPKTVLTNDIDIPKKPLIAKQATASNNTQNIQIASLEVADNLESTISRNYALTNPIATLPTVVDKRSSLSISVSEMNQHLTLHTETGNSIIHTVPSLRPNFVESQYITALNFNKKYAKIPARLRLGLVANLASTNAYVSGGELLDISAFTDKGFGYGIGGSLGFKYGKWEIETGLMYAAKQYDPNIVDTPKPNAKRTHFQTVYLQTMHVPVNLRFNYAVLGKGKWHFYGQLGAALNVILRAEYDLAEVSSISRSKVNEVTTSRINLIDFNNGFLAGDGFKDNRFLSINMGAGVERYITPRWSIFVQPDFHFHFSGNRIGTTEDKINTLSISFGARKSL